MSLLTGLVSYYKMEGNSTDSAGSNNGTDTAITYSLANGKIGQGAGFNGSSSSISLPTGVIIGGNAAQTQSIWFKLGNNTQVDKELTNITDGVTHVTFDFNYNSGIFSIRRIKQGVAVEQVTKSLSDTTSFHNAVMTVSGTILSLYFDGILVSSISVSGNGTTTGNSQNIGSNAGGSQFFNGAIDEVGIWSRALTSTEVTQLYNSGAGLQYPFTVGNPGAFFAFF